MKLLALSTFFMFFVISQAAFAVSSITYQGRIIKPNGSAFESATAQIKVQIRSPGNENCLMYEETFNRDMTGSSGVFSLNLNAPGFNRTDASGLTFDNVFKNTGDYVVPLISCDGGVNSFTLTKDSHRRVRFMFKDASMGAFEQLPDFAVNFVPFAMDTKMVGGFGPENLLRVEDASGPQTAPALTPANATELMLLLAGNSAQYTKDGELNGQTIPALGNGQTLTWNGAGWTAATPLTSETDPNTRAFAKNDLPTCGANEFLQPTGVNTWSCVAVTGASGGTVTSITVGPGLEDGTGATGVNITSTGTIRLPDLVVAGTGTKVTYDAKGRITGSAALDETDIPTLSTAGKVSGSAINTGTIGGNAAINTTGTISSGAITSSGNITTSTGTITGSTVSSTTATTRSLQIYDNDTNFVTVNTPADLTGNYVLQLPPDDGSTGQMLVTDGNGVLTWSSTAAGGVNGVGAFNGTATANGLSVTSNNISLHAADATNPGGVSTGAQTFAGAKTFDGAVTAGAAGTGLAVTNNMTVGGTIGVTGTATFSSTATVTGNLRADALIQMGGTTASEIALKRSGTAMQARLADDSGYAAFEASLFRIGGTTSSFPMFKNVGAVAETRLADDSGYAVLRAADPVAANDVATRGWALTQTGNYALKSGDTFTGHVVMANEREVRFSEATGGGTSYAAIKAPAALAGDYTLTLPTTDGDANQVLTTDGSGVLSWTNQTSSLKLNSLAAADATNTIDNLLNAQVWNWNTLTTQTAMTMASSSLTTGSVLSLSASNNNVASTGNVLKVTSSGASSAAVPLMLTNAGTGASFRVNDDGTDSDTSPFVVDAAGKVGIGTASPSYPLHIVTTSDLTNFVVEAQGISGDSAFELLAPLSTSTADGKAFSIRAISEGFGRAMIYTDGKIGLGGGAATRDTFLSRSAVSTFRVSSDGGSGAADLIVNGNVGIGATTPGAMLQLGTAGTSLGTMRLTGNTSGYVQIQPAAAAGSYVLTLPTTDGDANQVLMTDGSGVLSWTTPVAGGVTALAAVGSAPNANGGSISGATLTLQPADGTNPGVLTAGAQTIGGAKTFSGAGSFTAAGTGLAVTNNMTVGGTLAVTGTGTVTGNLRTDGLLLMGGTTSSQTALKRSGTAIQSRLADDSAYAAFEASLVRFGGTTSSFPMLSNTGAVLQARLADDSNYAVLRAADPSGANDVATRGWTLTQVGSYVLKTGDTMSSHLTMDNQAEVRLREASGGGTNYAAIRAPAAIGTDFTLTLPATAGAANQVLTTDGSGVLSWTTPGGGNGALSSITAATTTNTIANANNAQTWNWNSLTTQTAMSMGSSSMTSGTLLNLTGSYDDSSSNGNVLRVAVTGTSNEANGVTITNEGASNSLRINDDGTDTDSTPFVVDEWGQVGVGVVNPNANLHVVGGGGIYLQNADAPGEPTIRIAHNGSGYSNANSMQNNHAFMWMQNGNGNGSFMVVDNNHGALEFHTGAGDMDSVKRIMRIETYGVAINKDRNTSGITGTRASLDVNGDIVSAETSDVSSGSVIDFATGNLQYTSQACKTWDLWNLKNGGTYSLIVQSDTSATCAFNGFNDAGSTAVAFVKMPPGHTATTVNKHTVYRFLVVNNRVYVSWEPGFANN